MSTKHRAIPKMACGRFLRREAPNHRPRRPAQAAIRDGKWWVLHPTKGWRIATQTEAKELNNEH